MGRGWSGAVGLCATLWGAAQMWLWGIAGFKAGHEEVRRGHRAAGKRCYGAVSPPVSAPPPAACPPPFPPPRHGVPADAPSDSGNFCVRGINRHQLTPEPHLRGRALISGRVGVPRGSGRAGGSSGPPMYPPRPHRHPLDGRRSRRCQMQIARQSLRRTMGSG